MSWVIEVTDSRSPALAGPAHARYLSPPHSYEQATALLSVLLACEAHPEDLAWRHPIPGGQRSIVLRRLQSQSEGSNR